MAVNPQQMDIDFFSPAEDGYEIWQWERKEAEKLIAREWCLPIGENVRLKRFNIDGEFEGVLKLVRLPLTIDSKIQLDVELNNIKFPSSEIESCSVISDRK